MRRMNVPKSRFKPKAFEYFRMIEQQNAEICITDHGRPVIRMIPYTATDDEGLLALRGLVVKYKDPLKPIEGRWDADS